MVSFNRKFSLADSILVPLRLSPLYGGLCLLLSLTAAVVSAVQVLAVANFVDSVSRLSAGAPKAELLSPILWLMAMMAAQTLIDPVQNIVRARLTMKMRQTLRLAYVDKMSRLQYRHIESPEAWELINRIAFDYNGTMPVYMEERFSTFFDNMVSFLRVAGNIVSLIVVLTCQVWWIGLLMLVISIPILLLSYKLGGKNYDMGQQFSRFMRVSCNYGEMLIERRYALERFLFRFAPRLNEKWGQNYRFIRQNLIKLTIKHEAINKLNGLLGTVMSVALILCLTYFVSAGQVSVGIFLGMVTALFSLSQALSWELSYCLYALARDRGLLRDLSRFSLLEEVQEESQSDLDPGPFEKIELKNVRFRYPGTQQYVLDGVSLVIEKGKHYAFVGTNGAGKTTITKLLTGLYTDYEGEILINGIELRQIPSRRLLGYYAVVFQDFARYAISLSENVRLGNPDATPEQIRQAIRLVGLEKAVDALPKQENTPLGKIKEDGVDLSGGQWQRVAMARAVVSPAAVKILDEPTAALDPISESQVYERFGGISQGSTTIFISHRLGSTKLADVIFVLEKGKITEQGDYETLMENRSTYYTMFESQRSWYQ